MFILKQISLFGLLKEQIKKIQMKDKILSELNIVQHIEKFVENTFLNIIIEHGDCDILIND